MPARIIWTENSTNNMDALLKGGFTSDQIEALKTAIRNWIQAHYANWEEGEAEQTAINVRYPVTVRAEKVEGGDDEVEVLNIEAP